MTARASHASARDAGRQNRINTAVRRLISEAVLTNHEIAEHLGLGPSDAQFLALLEFHGPLSPGELARLSGLTTGTVTGVIDRLERARFVRRERDTADRRRVLVSRREDRIEREIAPLYADAARSLARATSHYSATELDLIAEFLERIARPPAAREPPKVRARARGKR